MLRKRDWHGHCFYLTRQFKPDELSSAVGVDAADSSRRELGVGRFVYPSLHSEKGTQIMRKLFNDEVGFVISAELVLVMTIAVLGMVVGLASVRDAINAEMVDLSNAFGAIDQSYNVRGSYKDATTSKHHARVAGFGYKDKTDDCDCKPLEYVEVCGKSQFGSGTENEGNEF